MVSTNDILVQQIALSNAKGMRAPVVRELLQRLGSISEFFSLSQAQLTNLVGHKSDAFADSYRKSLLESAEKEADFVRSNHINAVFIDSENYPAGLTNCEDAPVLLYTMGSCNLSSAHMVGIVGTRHSTFYGLEFTSRLVNDLASKLDNLVIVSGLAYGVDVAAHSAAINAGVPTVGVLAHGLNMIYPAEHRSIAAKMASNGGALVTEYSTQARIHRSNFIERNRIVAGLCDCLVVVESDFRGGSMSTARIASQYNREVFALPGRVTDKYSHGTNRLLRNQVASLITEADDLICMMGWETKTEAPEAPPTLFRPLSTDEQAVINLINEYPDSTINDICVRLSKSYSAVSNILMQLEMDDIIITLPGGKFTTI